jgi:hypothetical protein
MSSRRERADRARRLREVVDAEDDVMQLGHLRPSPAG